MTLTGERIDLDLLPEREYRLIRRLRYLLRKQKAALKCAGNSTGEMHSEEATRTSGQSEKGGADPRKVALRYPAAALVEISSVFPAASDFNAALAGAVGAVYRSGFFELYWEQLAPEQRQAFVENLQHNPGRILVETWLDRRESQSSFARATELDTAQVSHLFDFVLEPWKNSQASVALDKFKNACTKLGVVPRWRPALGDLEKGPLITGPVPISIRERHLAVVVSAVTRCLCACEDSEVLEACRQFLGLHLAALYGIKDVSTLDAVTAAFLRDILTPPQLRVERQAGRLGKEALEHVGDEVILLPGLRGGVGKPNLFAEAAHQRVLEPQLRVGPRMRGLLEEEPQAKTRQIPSEEDKALAECQRETWGRAFDIWDKWVGSDLFARKTREAWDQLHPSEERFTLAMTEGWSADNARHIDHCLRCQDRCRGNQCDQNVGAERRTIRVDGLRYRLFESESQEENYRRWLEQVRKEPLPAAELRVWQGNPVLSERTFFDRDLSLRLTREKQTLLVTVVARQREGRPARRPLLVYCTVRGEGDRVRRKYLVITARGEGLYAGECRFKEFELRELMPVDEWGERPLEFLHPEVTILEAEHLQEVGADERRNEILHAIEFGRWDDAAMQGWHDWSIRAKAALPEGPMGHWIDQVIERLGWRALPAVSRLLHELRSLVWRRLDERCDSLLATAMGRCRAEHGWEFIEQPRPKGGSQRSFKAVCCKNNLYKDWILLGDVPSIVKHTFDTRLPYCCTDSKIDRSYWLYKRTDEGPQSALAVPVVVRLTPDGQSKNQPRELGTVILESGGPNAFHPAQLPLLEEVAEQLVPHLLVRKHLAEADDQSCPWHPSFNEFKGENNCWHLIDILEQVCHAIVNAVNRSATVCSIWCIDHDKSSTFVLTSVGFIQEFKSRPLPFPPDGSQSALAKVNKLQRRQATQWQDLVEDKRAAEEELDRVLPGARRMGLLNPWFVPIYLEGDMEGKPSLMLSLCKTEVASHVKLPDKGELVRLAEVLGTLVDRFQELREQLAGAWFQHQLAKAEPTLPALFARMVELLKVMFQLDECSVWVRSPKHDNKFLREVSTLTESEPKRDFLVLQHCLRSIRGKHSFRLHDVRETISTKKLPELDKEVLLLPDVLLSGSAREQQPPRQRKEAGALFQGIEGEEKDSFGMILDLRRTLPSRPFTAFNERLLQAVVPWCRAIYLDWSREQRLAGRAGLKDLCGQPFPRLSSIPSLVGEVLGRLVGPCPNDWSLQRPSARVLFALEGSPVQRLAERPVPVTDRPVLKQQAEEDQDDWQAVMGADWQPVRRDTTYSNGPFQRYVAPFMTWVGRRFLRGALVLAVPQIVDSSGRLARLSSTHAGGKGEAHKIATGILCASQRLAAIFGRMDAAPPGFDTPLWDEPDYCQVKSPSQALKDSLPRLANPWCLTPTDSNIVRGNDLPDTQSWGQFVAKGAPPSVPFFEDLDHYGARYRKTEGSARVLFPLYFGSKVVCWLEVGLKHNKWLPDLAPTDSEPAAWYRYQGEVERLCGLVSAATGYWAYLTMGTTPVITGGPPSGVGALWRIDATIPAEESARKQARRTGASGTKNQAGSSESRTPRGK
jgi:hypothetical protein